MAMVCLCCSSLDYLLRSVLQTHASPCSILLLRLTSSCAHPSSCFVLLFSASSSSPRAASDLEQARPQTSGEEELQLQLALAMSREESQKVEANTQTHDLPLWCEKTTTKKKEKTQTLAHLHAASLSFSCYHSNGWGQITPTWALAKQVWIYDNDFLCSNLELKRCSLSCSTAAPSLIGQSNSQSEPPAVLHKGHHGLLSPLTLSQGHIHCLDYCPCDVSSQMTLLFQAFVRVEYWLLHSKCLVLSYSYLLSSSYSQPFVTWWTYLVLLLTLRLSLMTCGML